MLNHWTNFSNSYCSWTNWTSNRMLLPSVEQQNDTTYWMSCPKVANGLIFGKYFGSQTTYATLASLKKHPDLNALSNVMLCSLCLLMWLWIDWSTEALRVEMATLSFDSCIDLIRLIDCDGWSLFVGVQLVYNILNDVTKFKFRLDATTIHLP